MIDENAPGRDAAAFSRGATSIDVRLTRSVAGPALHPPVPEALADIADSNVNSLGLLRVMQSCAQLLLPEIKVRDVILCLSNRVVKPTGRLLRLFVVRDGAWGVLDRRIVRGNLQKVESTAETTLPDKIGAGARGGHPARP